MKKIFSLLAFAVLVAATASVSLAQSNTPSIFVSVGKYDPAPAEAGNTLELWVQARNIGSATAYNYMIEVVPEYPFVLNSGEVAAHEFAVIGYNGVNTLFKLRVAPDAPDGSTPLKVRFYPKGSSDYTTQTVNVSVIGKASFTIKSVFPDSLIPGNPTRVNFTFENNGKAHLRDLVVSWSDPSGKILSLAGDNSFKIDNLAVGGTTTVPFSMIADPSITQGVHKILVNATFLRFGTADTKISNVALIVGGLTDFEVSQQEVEDNTVSLSVANIGVNTGTAVSVSVPDQDGWEVVGGSSVFLGNLNPGDFTVGSLQVRTTSDVVKQNLKVKVEYTDTTGLRRSVQKDVSINFAQAMLNKKSDGTNPVVYAVVIVIVLAALWFANRRFGILRKMKILRAK